MLSKTDIVVLCGGLGKRLRNQIGEAQKTLAEIQGQPFLDILLKYFAQQGFRRAILCTGYHGDDIQKHYEQNTLGLEIVFSQEAEPLGTGGAIKHAQPHIRSKTFFALNGDCFCKLDYEKFLQFHLKQSANASLAITHVHDSKDYGSISIDNDNRITCFDEKVGGSAHFYVNVGIYCFDQTIFSFMPTVNLFSIEYDFFPTMVGKEIFGFKVDNEFIDIGTPERLSKAQQILTRVKGQGARGKD